MTITEQEPITEEGLEHDEDEGKCHVVASDGAALCDGTPGAWGLLPSQVPIHHKNGVCYACGCQTCVTCDLLALSHV
jgi:hypothetical protein